MRVAFTDAVLADEASWKWLDRILASVDDEWHLWDIDDPDSIEHSEWFRRAGRNQGWLRELLESSVRRSAWSHARGPHAVLVLVGVEDRLPCVLRAQSAARCLGTPLVILVENVDSDGAFLDVVLDKLGGAPSARLRQLRPPPIVYESPGGHGELLKYIERNLDDPGWTGVPRRFVVITDSDAAEPGISSKHAEAIARRCRERGVSCHVLTKRTIENYLPDEVLDDWASRGKSETRDWVKALSRLSAAQRDHFPLKKGLDSRSPEQVQPTLYSDLPADVRQVLGRGMGKALFRLFVTPGSRMTADTLRNRAGLRADGSTELDDLVATICAAL